MDALAAKKDFLGCDRVHKKIDELVELRQILPTADEVSG